MELWAFYKFEEALVANYKHIKVLEYPWFPQSEAFKIDVYTIYSCYT